MVGENWESPSFSKRGLGWFMFKERVKEWFKKKMRELRGWFMFVEKNSGGLKIKKIPRFLSIASFPERQKKVPILLGLFSYLWSISIYFISINVKNLFLHHVQLFLSFGTRWR
jgi:hypothetical protein